MDHNIKFSLQEFLRVKNYNLCSNLAASSKPRAGVLHLLHVCHILLVIASQECFFADLQKTG